MLIARYIFDSSIDTLPIFDNSFVYEYTDINNGDGTITRTITSNSSPTSISFNGKTGLVSVSYLETSNLTSAVDLFYNCTGLTYVDLRNSDFSKVESIERMFNTCTNLVAIDGLNDLDISNVGNMGGAFSDCKKLPEINVSNWDVSKVTNFGAAFRRCSKLTNIDVSKWDTSSGVIMSGIFTNCTGLIELDLSNWTVANSDTVSQMFYGCSNLATLKLFKAIPENSTTTLLFGKNNLLNEIQIDYLDTYTINTIISLIPTRTANNQGTLIVPKIDDYIDTAAASAKYWIVMADPTNIRLINLGDIIISNLYIGDIEIEKVYIGDIVIYENKQAVNDKELLYNEVTGTLFIIKKNAMSYDADNQVLNIDSDTLRLEYSEDNLNIGGDA
jgi:surface protein